MGSQVINVLFTTDSFTNGTHPEPTPAGSTGSNSVNSAAEALLPSHFDTANTQRPGEDSIAESVPSSLPLDRTRGDSLSGYHAVPRPQSYSGYHSRSAIDALARQAGSQLDTHAFFPASNHLTPYNPPSRSYHSAYPAVLPYVPFAGSLSSQPFNDFSQLNSTSPAGPEPFAPVSMFDSVTPHDSPSMLQVPRLASPQNLMNRPRSTASVIPPAEALHGVRLSPRSPSAIKVEKKYTRGGARSKRRKVGQASDSESGSRVPLTATGSVFHTMASGAMHAGIEPTFPSSASRLAQTTETSGTSGLSQRIESALAVLAKIQNLLDQIKALPSVEYLGFFDSYPSKNDPRRKKSNWRTVIAGSNGFEIFSDFEKKRRMLTSKLTHPVLWPMGIGEWAENKLFMERISKNVVADWYPISTTGEHDREDSRVYKLKASEKKLARRHAQHLLDLVCELSVMLPPEGMRLPWHDRRLLQSAAVAMGFLLDRIDSLQHWNNEI